MFRTPQLIVDTSNICTLLQYTPYHIQKSSFNTGHLQPLHILTESSHLKCNFTHSLFNGNYALLEVTTRCCSVGSLSPYSLTQISFCFSWMTSCYCLLPARMEVLKSSSIVFGLDFRYDSFWSCRLGVCQIRELSNRSHLASQQNNSLHFYQVKCQGVDDSLQNSISTEPKWKEKLAAVNENSNRMRIQSLQVHEEYKKQQVTLQREKLQVAENSYLLKDLDFIPCLTDEGLIRDISASDAKASVYAVFDETKILQYVGISRQVYMSMRLHFARVPSKCHFVKVQHIKQPNRVLLECIKDKWITENGFVPSGNDNGPQQSIWENPLDCKVLMTDEEKRNLQEAGAGVVEAKILKNVARRIEVQLDAEYKKRNCKETFRFEPKMKEKGLLDLRNKQPDKSVPASVPKPKSAS